MGDTIILILGSISLVAGLILSLMGIHALVRQRRAAASAPANNPLPITVRLDDKGPFTPEPGVLLNTLWEHLPNAACQSGECGGCKMRLLEGQVEWIREPIAEIDRSTHILACSCKPLTPLRCALD